MRIVVIGGGFGGIYSIKNLLKRFKGKSDIEIILINKNNYFLFTPLLHEAATGSIGLRNIIEPIRDILKADNFHFIEAEVNAINFNKRIIYHDLGKIKYHYVIVSIGSTENYFNVKHAQKYCLSLKSLKDAIEIKNRLVTALEHAEKARKIKERERWLRFIVVGGGPTGVELIAEIIDFVKQEIHRNYKKLENCNVEFYIIQKGEKLIPMFSHKAIKKTTFRLEKKGIKVFLGSEIKKVGKDFVKLKNKERIFANTIIWSCGIKPNRIKVIPQKILSNSGHFNVNGFLEIKNTKNAYAIGDCALFFNENEKNPIQALAQVAVNEASYVVKHIDSRLKNESIKRYNFKPNGYLISIGQRYAVGDISKINLSGFFAWWLWRTVYLFKLIGYRNKIRTLFDWTISLITRKRDSLKI